MNPFSVVDTRRVEADEIDHLVGRVLTEGFDGKPVERLRQDAAADELIGELVGDALLGAEIVRPQVGDQRRQPLRLHAFALRDRNVGVDLIGRIEAGADDQNDDLAHIIRKRRIGGHRQRQVPDRLSYARFMQPRIPRAHQGAVVAEGLEGVEVAGDALAHVVVKGFLLRRQVGGGDQG